MRGSPRLPMASQPCKDRTGYSSRAVEVGTMSHIVQFENVGLRYGNGEET